MKDVAALAGVSLSTVSRVVNGADVDVALAGRVQEAAQLLGYRRDHAASTLRRADRQSGSLGLIFEDVSNPLFSVVHRGVEDVARSRGVLTFAASSDDDPDAERELAHAFSERGVDGLIIVPAGDDHSYLLREREAGTALVFVDRPPRQLDADTVLTDNADGVRGAVARLVELGHRRIGFLGDRQRIFTAAERYRGFREALAGQGIEEDPGCVQLDLNDSELAHVATRTMLTGANPPTALLAGQNLITIGAIHALRELELQHTVALIGFDDLTLADAVEPALTVVAQDPVALGRRAAELVFSRLDGYAGPARSAVIPTNLIPRGSGELPPPAGGP
jgi:LacI family transcriptional regulator, galactose operon repressor